MKGVLLRPEVHLVGHYGGDRTHALSAWTSTRRELTEEREERLGRLLAQLAKDGHHTPFEKSYLHFVVVCDTATHIHILKHRIGVSVNAESARYKEHQEDRYHLPSDWPSDLIDELDDFCQDAFARYHKALQYLENSGFSRARAKESARFFLPYASQLTLDVGFNFRSFVGFQQLRNHRDAQREDRLLAKAMLAEVERLGSFTYSLAAFNLSLGE